MECSKNVPELSGLTMVRHEINQHLHNVHNANQLLSHRLKTAKDKSLTHTIAANNLSALKKIGNVMDYIATINGHDKYTQVNLQKIDIVKMVRLIVARIVEIIPVEHNINLSLKTGMESIFIVTDIKRVEKILYNLISNSVKPASQTGDNKISLEVKEVGNDVVISVRDLAGGITEAEEQIIFQAYKNAETSAISTTTGFGLGLAVSLMHAKQMNGLITFKNLAGKGLEFSLNLPKDLQLKKSQSFVGDTSVTFEPSDELIMIAFSDVREEIC